MTNKERVIAAIKGENVDRVPASFSLHFPKEIAKGESGVKAHLDFYRETGVDIMKIMNENVLLHGVIFHHIPVMINSSWIRLISVRGLWMKALMEHSSLVQYMESAHQ